MDCLLCLKISESDQKSIFFDSTEWRELNIEYIVEKYLWKMENLNNHSYMCQTCLQELYNFHKFYLKIEKAHKNLNILVNSEVFPDEESHDKGNLPEHILFDSKRNSQLDTETFFLKDENPLEICKEEDVEIVSCFKKTSKCKRYKKKSLSDKENITKCTTEVNKREAHINQDEIGIKLEEVEKDDVEKVICFKKNTERKRSGKKRPNSKKDIVENNSKKRFKRENSTIAVIKLKADKNQEGISIKLKEVENVSKKAKLGENESDSDPSLSSMHPLKQLHQYQDKFIAEHFQINCSLCDIPLASFAIMATHYKKEHNQRGYATCCGQKLRKRSEIVDHVKSHQNPDYFKCKQCDKTLSNRARLKTHIKTIHERKNVECDICGKSLANESTLRTHKLLHAADNKDKWPCKQCDKYFISKLSLGNHIRLVHLAQHIICDLCGKSIKDSYKFKLHMLKHEGKAKPTVSCKVCGRILCDMDSLKRHMQSYHPPNGVKPEFNCPVCTKTFTNTSNLRTHLYGVHENKYARNCTLCGSTLKSSKAFKDHMAFHTGNPVRACGICPKTFYSSSYMHIHRKKEHPKEWEESLKRKFVVNLEEETVTETIES